jgi:hypothetical protein
MMTPIEYTLIKCVSTEVTECLKAISEPTWQTALPPHAFKGGTFGAWCPVQILFWESSDEHK